MLRVLFITLAAGSLFVTNVAMAAEQKVIFELESTKARGSSQHTCAIECENFPKAGKFPKVAEMMKAGWRIISSSPKEVIQEDYRTVVDLVYGCTCVGTQYVLQKEEPAPVPKVETSNKEIELLKKEIELQKQEITQLKQENENLKTQLKPKQKKK